MKSKFLSFQNGTTFYKIPIDDILFIQVKDDYCAIITGSYSCWMKITMQHLLELLPENQFYRVHRFYTVNLNLVTGVGKNFLLVQDQRIPVSRSLSPAFNEQFIKSCN
ncbi:LytTR family transcriptional regulator [Flavihumibacter sp. RY-1]|uniref:LytTR family transcriptional regulator n=1 Tax=Flavihumibacter fluminis TaxID=2909236 RepID=A0ABS9BKR1_9BACT|nr:LytTR family DNA-binding domain-containing protein [Flavihumibacter fluminis]MCF1715226.1 LytTR family transcriptional regulator [Flavihumibacter fluminis]